MANGLFDCATSSGDDVLMTPVLNSPKSTDRWSPRQHGNEEVPFSPGFDLKIYFSSLKM